MKLLKLLNPENVSEQEADTYPIREATRAIVLDSSNKVAMLHVRRDHYYKIPGGGAEKGESQLDALKRECLEEIGCEIEVVAEVGKIIEYRKFCNLKQISYCYLARLKGEKGNPNFMPDEVAEGFQEIWVPQNEALSLLANNPGKTLESSLYIVPRDLIFLNYGLEYKK